MRNLIIFGVVTHGWGLFFMLCLCEKKFKECLFQFKCNKTIDYLCSFHFTNKSKSEEMDINSKKILCAGSDLSTKSTDGGIVS